MANQSLSTYVQSAPVSKRFIDVLGEKEAKRFCSALISICNGSAQLQSCDPRSITAAAGLAAVTGLSISPTLGQAYIVPFKGKAQFQVGWKGLVQLAHRTGKYTALNAGKVCEGEITGINPVTGEAILGEKISDEVVGYVAYMRLVNGFEKTLYMSKAEIEEHALKYSQSNTAFARVGIAVDRAFSKEKVVDFFNLVAFGKTAEFLGKWFSKGSKLLVEGRLQTSKYKDKEGNERTSTEVVVDNVEFADSKKKEQGNGGGNYGYDGYDVTDDTPF